MSGEARNSNKPVALLPPANSVSVLCSDLAKARAELLEHKSYGYALLKQRVERELRAEIAKARATFRIVR
jgi:hypothetical protein